MLFIYVIYHIFPLSAPSGNIAFLQFDGIVFQIILALFIASFAALFESAPIRLVFANNCIAILAHAPSLDDALDIDKTPSLGLVIING